VKTKQQLVRQAKLKLKLERQVQQQTKSTRKARQELQTQSINDWFVSLLTPKEDAS